MTQILQKRPAAITLRAGSLAKQHIQQEGLSAHQVDMIPGAAGGPKGIGLMGLDQAIFGDFLISPPTVLSSLSSMLPRNRPLYLKLFHSVPLARY